MPPVIVLDQLTKRFGAHTAVQDVSFEVKSGEVFGLLGPNGSGKTTILRILTCYLQPTSGRALISGIDVNANSLAARQKLGYVPEDVPLYPSMQVEEFLAFMAAVRGLAGKAAERSVDRAIDQLSLIAVRKVAIAKISRGYRQRTMIAQALLGSPELLILDEPTNGLDPRQIIDLRTLIRDLSQNHTILITSHILSEIERVASSVAILLNGKLLTVRSLTDNASASLFVRTRPGAAAVVRKLLQEVPGVNNIIPSSQTPGDTDAYVLNVDHPDIAANVATSLSNAGIGLLELRTRTTDLEDLFLESTQGEPA